ncbi:MAG: sodium:alanine symporter family protein [Nitrospinae bacterium]|nr:sodium:alanine symporter family protein [Nitrospinota bacterium]
MDLIALLNEIDGWVWGAPLITLLLGVGVYLTFLLRGFQFTQLYSSLHYALVVRREKGAAGDISHFQALMTALSATVGTGNIAGVATAIAMGGPGAVFWMWMTGLFGMASKYAEALLAVKYRYVDHRGNMVGGPMVYIKVIGANPGWRWLAGAFALFAGFASFGIGDMVQSNSVADALDATFDVPRLTTGVILGVMTGVVILGGVRWIARVASVIVPFMIFFYCAGAMAILAIHLSEIPAAFALILDGAFSGTAATGGFAGAAVSAAIRFGVARGVFSNESGMGSAAIAAAAAQTNSPARQGAVAMTQTFIDTLIVCTMTALVIIVTGVWTDGASGAALTTAAFAFDLGGAGEIIVAVSLALFAYSTLIGWSYYGEKGLESLFGEGVIVPYRIVYCLAAALGATLKLEVVWTLADIANGLMAVPNLIALVALSPVVVAETKAYLALRAQERGATGN